MAMKCQNCEAENPEHVAYCGQCGESVREWPAEATPDRGLSSTSESTPKKVIEWTPLLIVIGAAYLISLSLSGVITVWGSDSFELEGDLSIILGFLASTALIVTMALVIYQKEDLGKKSLIIGMVFIICMLALRTSVYLRAL